MLSIFQADRCIICHQDLSPSIGWVSLFSKETDAMLCEQCLSKLEKISGETCEICGRGFNNGEYTYKRGNRCFDCIRWEEDREWKDCLEQNISIFHYNDFLKEILATFKYRGDYIIARAFRDDVRAKLKKMKFDYLVPIPLSAERLYERGFNQAEALITEAGFKATDLLARLHTEKQSKKTRSDRIHLPQVFHLNELTSKTNLEKSDLIKTESAKGKSALLCGKNILLVDDIYTTGSTIRHAAKVCRNAGAASVRSFTLARG